MLNQPVTCLVTARVILDYHPVTIRIPLVMNNYLVTYSHTWFYLRDHASEKQTQQLNAEMATRSEVVKSVATTLKDYKRFCILVVCINLYYSDRLYNWPCQQLQLFSTALDNYYVPIVRLTKTNESNKPVLHVLWSMPEQRLSQTLDSQGRFC